ncbi:hypothetical protein [Streptomyces sp. MMG1121]|uniref:hypothetical protein n=1 Tax=Streptomyces sp. MMG1121 TaxID=1415544 RepID=UPI0006B04A51|nr:hypothetical protein [Streptomyces sp. MMG1121]KOV60051.1 hypothetical protein ADK64_32335 [Streptomyces sp. MMG1121]
MLRLLALLGAVTAAVVLPFAVASAGQVGEEAQHTAADKLRDTVRPPGHGDAKLPAPRSSARLLGLGLATAARCGPALTSPDGIEAQTCVLTQGEDTWARTYYRNATGESLDSVLSLMGPDGHSVEMSCVTSADDEPATCETPRERSRGGAGAYTAVAEFAKRGTDGALLLRAGSDPVDGGSDSGSGPVGSSGSNSREPKGS